MSDILYHYIVTDDFDNERIDKVLSTLSDSFSRTYIKKMLDEKRVTLNGKVIKPSAIVCENDEISMLVPPAKELCIEAEDIPLDILYEDSDLLVVNKPKGMVVHPAAGHYNGTLVNAVMWHCKGQLSAINGVLRPGIVHRIDKDTTGSVIICKNDAAHQSIAAQLKEHSICRIYHAIVYGILPDDSGIIDAPIGRSTSDRKKMAVNVPHAKHAVTHYHTIKRFEDDQMTYVWCKLETGRTHQIRVHMAHIGHPILGDEVYAMNRKSKWKLEGQCLHAKTLGFIHPVTGDYIETDAPLPEYFQHLLDILH